MKTFNSLILILLALSLYSSTSDPSECYGSRSFSLEVKEDSWTRYFYISYPFDMGFAEVGDIDPYGQRISIISEYSNSYSKWVSASYVTDIGWVTNFNIKKGGAYNVYVHSDNSKALGFAGKYELLPPHNLISLSGQFYYKGLSFIMMPQEKYQLNSAVTVGNDLINCDMVSKRHYLTNDPLYANYDTLACVWDSDFPMNITDPFFVNVRSSQIWPVANNKYIIAEGKSGNNFINDPMPVYYNIVNSEKNAYDFRGNNPKSGQIKFKAWITGRENEILTDEDFGCGYEQIGEIFSAIYINLGNFETRWMFGDEVNFEVIDEGDGEKSVSTKGTGKYRIETTHNAIMRGFEPMIKDSGLPIVLGTPSGDDESAIPYHTALYQNYPNPFNPVTSIMFSLRTDCKVKLNVFNYKGQVVKEIVNDNLVRGYHKVDFDASNMSSGLYFYTLEADNMKLIKKMVLVR